MISMEKLLFIASIQHGEPPTGGGAQAKNQLLLAQLQKYYNVIFFDTWNKSSIVSLLFAILLLIFCKRKCVLSISTRGALSIGKLIKKLHIKKHVFYFVIGGDLGNFVEGHLSNVPVLKSFDKIFVEGHYMKVQLDKVGLENVCVLPNFKPIGKLPNKKRKVSSFIKFVFLGRLIEEKGVDLVLKAAKKLNKKYVGKFSVTFYGSTSKKYPQEYFESLEIDNVSYGGFLNLTVDEGIEALSKYDVMVFPTYFDGEGFPGVLIDAFKAGLPVIASDFHANPDVINKNTFGTLIKPKDSQALAIAMEHYLSNPSVLDIMSKAVQKEVYDYDINNLLSEECLNNFFNF